MAFSIGTTYKTPCTFATFIQSHLFIAINPLKHYNKEFLFHIEKFKNCWENGELFLNLKKKQLVGKILLALIS